MSRGAGRQGEPPPFPEPLAVEVADSHCHLDLMGVSVDQALAEARAVGVTTIVQVGVDLPSSRWSAQLAAEHDDAWAAVAVHPNEAATGAADDEAMREIEALAALPQVRAVGETGLDRYRTPDEPGRRRQEESFRVHLAIAKRTGKALMIHDRDAHDGVLEILAQEGPPDTVIFHCFSGDAEMARACADRGYLMSFAGPLTFASSRALREAAAAAPGHLLLVETDAPFLTPMPYRGRPNAPYLVPLTLRELARVRGEDVEELAAAVAANGRQAFGLTPQAGGGNSVR